TDIAQCETAVPLPQYPTTEIAQSAKGLEEEMAKKIGKIIEDTHNKAIFTNLIMRYQNFGLLGKRIVLIAKTLDKQFSCNLEGLAKKTAKKLQAHVKLGNKRIAGEVTDDEYKNHWKSLVGSAKSLLEKAEEAID
ncbi:unnamed protein product, partial [marine sediment metagenome]